MTDQTIVSEDDQETPMGQTGNALAIVSTELIFVFVFVGPLGTLRDKK